MSALLTDPLQMGPYEEPDQGLLQSYHGICFIGEKNSSAETTAVKQSHWLECVSTSSGAELCS